MPIDRRAARVIALTLPVTLPVAMTGVFRLGGHRLGPQLGYVAGFAAYWATCLGVAAAILGPGRALDLVVRGSTEAPARPPTRADTVLLAWPVAGAVTTRMLPELRTATAVDVATIAAVAQLNAVAEELLWRGVYPDLWPDDPRLGWVWPAIGFGAWHLAPQAIHPASMGRARYAVASTALGLSWGRVAWRTRSLRWTTLSHVITDASGIRNARFFLGGPRCSCG
jgi:membrane protease YdiL (CAAX protease family)